MRNLIVFIFLFSLQARSNIFSQSKINVDLKNSRIESLIKVIESQTQLGFLYDEDFLKNTKLISVSAKNETVENVLKVALEGTGLGYEIDHNTILLKPLPVEQSQPKKQEKKTIQGKITDEKGIGIPGASILVKGTTIGVSSDIDGNYTLLIPNTECTLVVSFVGMITQEVNVTNQTHLNVILKEAVSKLDDVVVTGYQTISRERAAGSFSKVSSEIIETHRLSSLDDILEGRIAGLSSGVIRGTTTMNGVTNPLYVIDGFPVENTRFSSTGDIKEALPDLNLEDIESITVLKDAAATSIYGARAANGVVVIVTKKAAKGETNISFSSSLTVSPYRYYTGNLLDAADMIDLEKEYISRNPYLQATDGSAAVYAASTLSNAVFQNEGIRTMLNYYTGNISESEMNSKLNSLAGMGDSFYKDIEKYAKQNPFYQKYNLSYGKTNNLNSFNASVTYQNNKYEDIYSNDESIGINLRNSVDVAKWLTFDFGTYIYYQEGKTQTFNQQSLINDLCYLQPYDRLVNSDGTPHTFEANIRYPQYQIANFKQYGLYSMDITPLEELKMNLMNNRNFLNRSYVKFNFNLAEGLKYSAMFQYEYGVDRANQLKDKNSFYVRSRVNGLATISGSKAQFNLPYGDIYYSQDQFSNAYNFRQQADFNKTINKKHDLTAIAGMEVKQTKLEYQDITLYGYDKDMLSYTTVNPTNLIGKYGSFGIYNTRLTQNDFSSQRELLNRFVSLYSNVGYSYDRKYLLTGSLRWDRSNLWGTSNKYQNKPAWSLGGGWNIDKERFFNVKWVNALKMRTSYGIGGNIVKGTAPYMTASYQTSQTVGGKYGIINSRPNPELSWERTATLNLGVDFAMFSQRLNGSVDYYNKKSSHLLTNTNGVPTEGWGYGIYTVNNGEMVNNGFEVMLNGTIYRKDKFSWDATVTYGHNKNKVTYVNNSPAFYFDLLYYPTSYPIVGNSYNSVYGFKDAGLSSTGLSQVYNSAGEKVSTSPTDLESVVKVGTTVPIHSGSFSTKFRYSNFDLSMLFVFQAGHVMRNPTPAFVTEAFSRGPYSLFYISNKEIANRWRKPGDENTTNIPRAIFDYDADFENDLITIGSYSSANFFNASNIRLSNISLAYNVPSSLSSRLKLKNVRLNFNIENVFMLAKTKEAKYMLGGYKSENYVFGLNVNF